MTPTEFAYLLDGREYGEEITADEEKSAKSAGLVVVFGYSDDNMEFRGAINDEVGCYGGGLAFLTQAGLLENKCDNNDCPYHAVARKKAETIEAVWDEKSIYAWTYRTLIPHATFEVVEDGEPYCKGIVFKLSDVQGVN